MAWHMTAQFRTRLAWAAFGLSGLLIAGSLALVVWHPSGNLIPLVLLFVGALSYSGVGAVILVRQPANRMGWLLLATGVLTAAAIAVASYGVTALIFAPGLPFGIWAAWTFGWLIWLVLVAIPLALLV